MSEALLIAIAAAGLWYGGSSAVHGAKKVGHKVEQIYKHFGPCYIDPKTEQWRGHCPTSQTVNPEKDPTKDIVQI